MQSVGLTTEQEVQRVRVKIQRRRPVQYSTVLKFLRIMAEKGLLWRDETQQQVAGHLLERAFGGSTKAFLLGALSSKKTTKSELQKIRKMLDATFCLALLNTGQRVQRGAFPANRLCER